MTIWCAGWYLWYKPVRGIPTQGSLGNGSPQWNLGAKPRQGVWGTNSHDLWKGVPWRARRARAYNGSLGPGPGAEPLHGHGVRGAKPPEAPFSFLTSRVSGKFALFSVLFLETHIPFSWTWHKSRSFSLATVVFCNLPLILGEIGATWRRGQDDALLAGHSPA